MGKKKKPECFKSNNDVYPLCKGKEEKKNTKCKNCSLYENMSEPYDYI